MAHQYWGNQKQAVVIMIINPMIGCGRYAVEHLISIFHVSRRKAGEVFIYTGLG